MLFQGAHDLFHGQVPLEEHPARRAQHEARHQAQDHMPVIGVFGACLTGLSGSKRFQDAEHVFDPVALSPGLHQPGDLDRQGHRDERQRLLSGLVHDDEQDLTIGSTPGPQPHRAAARCRQTLLPGPMVGLDDVRACDLAPVLTREGRGAFALHQQGPLMRARHRAHQLGVAAPALGHDHRGGELHPPFGQSRHALSEHGLGQGELVVAAPSGACGIGPTHGTGDRDDARAIAHDDQEEDAIDTRHGAFALATVPGADEPEVPAGCSADRIIDAPSPRPAPVGGGAVVLGRAPHGDEHRKAQAPQACEPRSCGHSVAQPGRDMRVPSAHAGEFMALSASNERGKHERDDVAQQLLLGLQAACDLGHQGRGAIQVLQGLLEGLERVLGLSALVREALLGCESTAFSGLDVFVGVSFHGGHGEFLRTVLVFL